MDVEKHQYINQKRENTIQWLRPLNDFIFKKLFGETENIDNLKSFINAVLNKDKTQELVELEIINKKQPHMEKPIWLTQGLDLYVFALQQGRHL